MAADKPGVRRSVRSRVLPASQRRTLEELTEDLDLRSGDASSKQSACWTMLTLSDTTVGDEVDVGTVGQSAPTG